MKKLYILLFVTFVFSYDIKSQQEEHLHKHFYALKLNPAALVNSEFKRRITFHKNKS